MCDLRTYALILFYMFSRVILSEGQSPQSKFCACKIAVGGISGKSTLKEAYKRRF